MTGWKTYHADEFKDNRRRDTKDLILLFAGLMTSSVFIAAVGVSVMFASTM